MVATANDISVAAAESARRSDNEILPEHEAKWPQTAWVEAIVRERYDGTSSTNHAIGQELLSPLRDGGCYPSWRIEQIARQLGLAEVKRDEMIQRVRAAEEGGKTERQKRQGAQPAPTSVIARPPAGLPKGQCEQCGQPFEAWRQWKGRPVVTAKCHDCWRASHKQVQQHDQQETTQASPATSATPTTPRPGWVDVLPPAEFVTLADGSAVRAVLDCPLDDAKTVRIALDDEVDGDLDLTFGDLVGSRAVFELLDLLPTNSRWTQRRREKWQRAFMATLDLLIDEVDDEEAAR